MPNASTVDRVSGVPAVSAAQGTKAAPTITLVATTEKLVLDATGATATVNAQPNAALSATNPDGFAFKVRAAFKTTTGGTSTSVVNMYIGSTIVAGNKLASITSQSLATASASGFLEAYCIWDGTSLKVSGYQSGAYGTTLLAPAALTNTAISVTSIAGLVFCLSATNGSSVVGTAFTADELVFDVV